MLPINAPYQARNLLGEATRLMQGGERIALLTLINIEGSAPYPIGSQMLVAESGEYFGQITGGCAETALADQAILAIKQGKNQTHRYGLDSPFFDIQLPCGSGIDVLIDVTTSLADYSSAEASVAARQTAELSLGDGSQQFTRRYPPNERLMIFGQGPILAALAVLGIASGFEVIAVVQDEPDVVKLTRRGVKATTLSGAQELYNAYLDSYTAVVSLFHEHEREPSILITALGSRAFYIGALGSKRTHAERLDALSARGISAADLACISGPVGLDINAESPEQIAVSILAEVIANMPKQRA